MEHTNISCQAAQLAVLVDVFRSQTSQLQDFYLTLASTGNISVTFSETSIGLFSRVLEDTFLLPETLSILHKIAVGTLPAGFDPDTVASKVSQFYKGTMPYEPDVSQLGEEEERTAVKVYEAFLMVMRRMEQSRRAFADMVVAKFGLGEECWVGGGEDELKLTLARAVYEPVEKGGQHAKVQKVLDAAYECYEGAAVVLYFPESCGTDFFVRRGDGGLQKMRYEWEP